MLTPTSAPTVALVAAAAWLCSRESDYWAWFLIAVIVRDTAGLMFAHRFKED